MATVYIPSLIQKLTDGCSVVTVPGSSVRQIVENLEQKYPGIKERLVDGHRIKPSISVSVDGQTTPLGMMEEVRANSEIHFLTAIGGGCL